jgi:hypothetical protein
VTVTKTKTKSGKTRQNRRAQEEVKHEEEVVSRPQEEEVEVLPYHLRMRLAAEQAAESADSSRRSIVWAEDVIDNEFMNKKSSKSTYFICIFI